MLKAKQTKFLFYFLTFITFNKSVLILSYKMFLSVPANRHMIFFIAEAPSHNVHL